MKFKNNILWFILLIGIVILSACGDGAVTGGGDTGTTAPRDTGEPGENGQEDIDPRQAILDLYQYPDVDFGGYNFRVMIRGQRDEWDNRDVFAEEETGEVVNDAVFRRNLEVEDALGIEISVVWVPEYQQRNSLRNTVAAGDNAFDAVMMNFESLTHATQQGFLVNLDNLAGIDLSHPWWDQSLLRDTSVMNRNYFATGDITIMTNDGTWTMMFNKQLARDFDLPNIYDIVRAGEWTAEKMLELGRGVSMDLDGNGIMNQFDQYAFTTTMDSVQGLFFSMGNRITRKNALDLPEFALYGEQLMRNLELMFEIMRGADNFTLIAGDFGNHLISQAAFEENRALFLAEVMQLVIRLRQMETDFGVIPMPKASAAQEKYLTNIHQWASSAVAIPRGIQDEERSATVIEALAYGGFKYIRPAYYDIALQTMHARDEESGEMLDIILAGRLADFGRMNDFGGVMGALNSNVQTRNPAFASTLERLEDRLHRDIERAIQRLEDLMY